MIVLVTKEINHIWKPIKLTSRLIPSWWCWQAQGLLNLKKEDSWVGENHNAKNPFLDTTNLTPNGMR